MKIIDKVNIKQLILSQISYREGVKGRVIGLLALACLLILVPFGKGFAQQLPFSSQYYSNPFVLNPAYTGINENISVFLTHRSQWTGLAGAPQTSYFTIDGPVRAKNSSVGLKVYSDVTDIISRVGAFANYSYKFKIADSNNLYFGVACGVFDNKIDFSKAQIRDTDDPFLSQQAQNKTVFSADLGIVYVLKRLTIGFAVPQILGNRLKYPIVSGNNGYYNLNRHYQGTAKYVFDVSKEKAIIAYPLIMVRSVKGAPLQYDINGVIDWKKIGWVGVTYHSNYAMAISAGVRYRSFSVGYAFDIGISKISSYTGSTSEFLLGYVFQNKKEEERFVKVEDRINIAALSGNGNEYNDSMQLAHNQMKVNYDASLEENRKLKEELEKTKTAVIIPPTTGKETDEFNLALAAKLKAREDANQAEIDRLKAELEKSKTAKTGDAGTASITIRLVDEKNNPISDAQVKVTDVASNKVIATPTVESDGSVRISVPAGKPVEILITKSGYLYKSFNLTPDSGDKKVDNITLEKVEVGKKLVMNNIAFELNQSKLGKESFSELDNALKLLKDIPSLEIEISGHTDNTGPVENNERLSRVRAKAVHDYLISNGGDKKRITYKGYGSRQPIASNDTKEGRKLNRRTEFQVLKVAPEYSISSGNAKESLTKILETPRPKSNDTTSQALEVGKRIIANNISFDVSETSLQKESFVALDVFVKLMKDIPSLEIEVSGHTDNLGSSRTNQELSVQRAKAVLDYIASKGIDKNRMTYKGYGSSDPIESNSTIEGRKKNRRIEFEIVKVAPGYSLGSNVSPSSEVDLKLKPKSTKKKRQYKRKGTFQKNPIKIGGKK
ncbi:MAG: PorP/SprF family type IX secretion system membrane protein [Bacteroidia bacterium]|nr:PorP/SprF family type IX secretion system membrane protein [Bacteroidia bacterium]